MSEAIEGIQEDWFRNLLDREPKAWQDAQSGNPYPTAQEAAAFNPAKAVGLMINARETFKTAVATLDPQEDFALAMTNTRTQMESIDDYVEKEDRFGLRTESGLNTAFRAAFDLAKEATKTAMETILKQAEEVAQDKSVAAALESREEIALNKTTIIPIAEEIVANGIPNAFSYADHVSESGTRRPEDVMDHAKVKAVHVATLGFTNFTASDASAQATLQAAIGDILGDASKVDLLDMFSSALTQAKTVLDDADTVTLINNMVTSFEEELTPQLNRAFNRFAGGMVDINAVEGSAFMIGLSNIERENLQGVNKFRNELTLGIFNNSYDKFITSAMQMFNQYLEYYIREKLAFIGLYKQAISQYISVYSDLFSQNLSTFVNSYNRTLDDAQQYSQRELATNHDYINMEANILGKSLSMLFDKHIQAKLQAYGHKDNVELAGIAQISDNTYRRMQTLATEAQTAYVTFSKEVELKTAYQENKLRRGKERRVWRLDMINKSAIGLVGGKLGGPGVGQKDLSSFEKGLAIAAVGIEVASFFQRGTDTVPTGAPSSPGENDINPGWS